MWWPFRKRALRIVSERAFIEYPRGKTPCLYADGATWAVERICITGKVALRYLYRPDVLCESGEMWHNGKPGHEDQQAIEKLAALAWVKSGGEPWRIEKA